MEKVGCGLLVLAACVVIGMLLAKCEKVAARPPLPRVSMAELENVEARLLLGRERIAHWQAAKLDPKGLTQ